jgi:hypothetical protein
MLPRFSAKLSITSLAPSTPSLVAASNTVARRLPIISWIPPVKSEDSGVAFVSVVVLVLLIRPNSAELVLVDWTV